MRGGRDRAANPGFGARGKSAIAGFKRLNSMVARSIGLNLDVRSRWIGPACDAAEELQQATGFDIVVSSYGPKACHIIASRLKKKFPKLMWVADYRDLWSGSPTLNGLFKPLNRLKERKICSSASFMTAASNGFAKELNALHAKKAVAVTNGFDSSMAEIEELYSTNILRQRGPDSPIQIVYTGNFYTEIQDPRPLLRAVARMRKAGRVGAERIVIDFYGALLRGLDQIVRECESEEFVRIHSPVSRQEALDLQRAATAVLLLEVLETESGGILPGKVFEYMASCIPMICVGDGKDAELARIVEETGVGLYLGADEDAIAKAVGDLAEQSSPEWFAPDFGEIAGYSRSVSAAKLLNVMRREKRRAGADSSAER
jgi:glycosyltransferase involved in cell wall biosynthesis